VVGKDYASLERECEETAYVRLPASIYNPHEAK
jgi:hypothetical protein